MTVEQVWMSLPYFLLEAAVMGTVLLAALMGVERGWGARRPRPAWRSVWWSAGFLGLLCIPIAAALPAMFQWHTPLTRPAMSRLLPIPVDLSGALQATGWSRTWITALVGLYLAGAALSMMRIGLGVRRMSRLRRSAVYNAAAPHQERLRMWRGRLDIKCPVEAALSADVRIPMVAGIRRPVILLPSSLAEPPSYKALDGVLTHELAHVLRRDAWWNILTLFVAALYWYHPLIYPARRRFIAAREEACDDWSVELLGDRRAYASTLLTIAVYQQRQPALAWGLDLVHPAGIVSRVDRLLSANGPVASHVRFSTRAALFGAVLLGVLILTLLQPVEVRPLPAVPGSLDARLPGIEDAVVYDTPPAPVVFPNARYSQAALQAGIEELILLKILIDASGAVREVRVIRGNHAILVDAAVAAARQSVWTPAKNGGKPVAVWIPFPMRFRFKDTSGK